MWWLSGPDKPSCVSEAHPAHLLTPAHQSLQDQIRLSGSYKKRQTNMAVIEGTHPGPGRH